MFAKRKNMKIDAGDKASESSRDARQSDKSRESYAKRHYQDRMILQYGKLNNFKSFATYYLNKIKKDFPLCATAIENQEEPTFLKDATTSESDSEEEVEEMRLDSLISDVNDMDNAEDRKKAIEALIKRHGKIAKKKTKSKIIEEERLKQAVKDERDYKLQSKSLCGDLMNHLSRDSEAIVKGHADYDQAYSSNDAMTLWNIVRVTHQMKPGSDLANQERENEKLLSMRQGNSKLHIFLEEVEYQYRLCESLGDPPSEERLCNKMIKHIDQRIFSSFTLQHTSQKTVPSKWTELKLSIQEYYDNWLDLKDDRNRAYGIISGEDDDASERALYNNTKKDRAKNSKFTSKSYDDRNKSKLKSQSAVKDKDKETCSFCGKLGHSATLDKNNGCWALQKLAKNASGNQDKSEKSNLNVRDDSNAGNTVLLNKSRDTKSTGKVTMIFDTGSTSCITPMKDLLRNAQPSSTQFNGVEKGMTANASAVGEIARFGKTFYVKDSVYTIISHNAIKDKFRITYDNDIEDVYHVSDDKISFAFRPNEDGLYECTVGKKEFACPNVYQPRLAIDSKEREQNFNAKERERIEIAQELHLRSNHLSDDILCQNIDAGRILDCPISSVDIRNMRKVKGPCPGCVQGKMVAHPQLNSTVDNSQYSIGELQYGDLLFIRDCHGKNVPYSIFVDHKSGAIDIRQMPNRTAAAFKKVVDALIDLYKSYGHSVKEIRYDREGGVDAIKGHLLQRGVQLRQTAAGQHVGKAEVTIRVIQSHFRASLYYIKSIYGYEFPRKLYPWLVKQVVRNLNSFSKPGLELPSPQEQVTGRKLSFKYSMRASFGEIILVKTPFNATAISPRAEYAIMLGNDISGSGVLTVYLLDSGKIGRRFKFERVVVPENVLRQVRCIHPSSDIQIESESESISEEITSKPMESIIPPAHESHHEGEIEINDEQEEYEKESEQPKNVKEVDISQSVQSISNDEDQVSIVETSVADDKEVQEDISHDDDNISLDATTSVILPNQRYDLRPHRSSWKNAYDRKEYGLHFSLKKVSSLFPDAAKIALHAEANQLIKKKVFTPKKRSELTSEQLKLCNSTVEVCKIKMKPDGSFDKVKVRVTYNGSSQWPELTGDTWAPVARIETIFMVITLAVKEEWDIFVVDMVSAYLNASADGLKQRWIKFSKQVTEAIVAIIPAYASYINPDGTLYAELNQVLYGMKEAGARWNQLLMAVLGKYGYIVCDDSDRCCLQRTGTLGSSRITLVVDDCLCVASSKEEKDSIIDMFRNEFKEINIEEGNNISYIGMTFKVDRVAKSVTVTQKNFVDELLDNYKVTGTVKTPASLEILKDTSAGTPVKPGVYLSLIMSLMYLGKRTRPDILFAVSYLATKSAAPTSVHMKHAQRILKYLNGSRELGITLSADKMFNVNIYGDSSYNIHSDGKGHTGVMVSFGGGPLLVESNKQPTTAKSSTVAELIALNVSADIALWINRMLNAFGYEGKYSTTLYQDNLSTKIMAENGFGNFKRNRYLRPKYFFVKEHLDNKEFKIKYLPTKEMVADILTKPIVGRLFMKLRALLLNICEGVMRK